jgi:hypothetical protein
MAEPNPNESGSQEAAFTINNVDEVLGELKGDPSFKPYEGQTPKDFISNIVKGYANQNKMIGGEKIVLPAGKLDTPENWNALFDKAGRPKDAEGYKLERPEKLPEGMTVDENREKNFKAVAHYLGLLPWQVAGLYQWDNQNQIDRFNTYMAGEKEKGNKALTDLQKEFKTKDAFDEHVKLAKQLLSTFGGTDKTQIDAFIDKFGDDPFIIKMMGNAAKVMSEDSIKLGEKRFDIGADDVKSKLDSIMSNKEDPLYKAYWDNQNPKHKDAVDEVYRLNTLIHGEQNINAT